MRTFFPCILGFISLTAFAEAPQPTCEIKSQTFDSRDVSCVIPASTEAQHFDFVARFSGGHDDTRATLQATHSGTPITCEEGSKQELLGEDGDIKLLCRFSAPEKQTQDFRFDVTIQWKCAEYTDFTLVKH